MKEKPLIIALDVANFNAALTLARELPPELCRVKVGKELFTAEGKAIIKMLHQLGHEVFLDLKFHDIPNTVAGAVRAAAELGVWMVNVHASGGRAMMEAAADALANRKDKPILIAVTVLTSSNEKTLQEIGIEAAVTEQVARLTALAKDSGMQGVVCSAQEASAVKKSYGKEFLTVTPGIRPSWASADDQARIVTPEQARQNGSDFLVIGRPVNRADNPRHALEKIAASIHTENF